MKKGAENFFKEIGSLHPKVQEAMFHTRTEPYLNDEKAQDLRADWKPKDNPITDWERTAHFRNGHAPPWLETDKTEAAESITESFNRSMGHLEYTDAKQGGYQLAEILAHPTENQLEALASEPSIRDLSGETDVHNHERMEFIKQQMGEGFAVNDTKTVQGAMDQLGYVQHQLNQIDPLLEHHDSQHPPESNEKNSLTDRIRTVLGNLWGSLSEEDLKAGGTRPGPGSYEHNLDVRMDYENNHQEQAQTTFELPPHRTGVAKTAPGLRRAL